MFEYQTAICELTGLPVSNASVYEGPSAVGAAGYLAKLANGQAPARRLARRCTRTAARRSRTLSRGYGTEVVEVPLKDGVTDAEAWAAAIDDGHERGVLPAAELPRRGRGRRGARAPPAKDAGASSSAPTTRSRSALLAHARRVRRRRRRRRGPAARQPPRLRRAVVRLLRRDRGLPAPHARPHRRRDDRRRRAARLRAHAADPRAAHPPREGDVEHLHLAGAERAGRRRLPELAGPRGRRRARRAAAPAHRTTRARRSPRSTASSCCTSSRSCASSRSRCDVAGVEAVAIAPLPATRASTRATRSAATRGARGRAARRDHRAAHARGHRPPRRRARRAPSRPSAAHGGEHHGRATRRRPGGAGMSAPTQSGATPMQRERATTIFEKGAAGPPRVRLPAARRAAARRRRAAPGAAAPHDARPPAARSPSPSSSATTCACSRRNFDLDSGFYPLGSCTMKHNPRLHERVAALPGHARLHPLQDPSARAGCARADVEPGARAGRDRGPPARLAPAVGRLARRARRAAADARLPRGRAASRATRC